MGLGVLLSCLKINRELIKYIKMTASIGLFEVRILILCSFYIRFWSGLRQIEWFNKGLHFKFTCSYFKLKFRTPPFSCQIFFIYLPLHSSLILIMLTWSSFKDILEDFENLSP